MMPSPPPLPTSGAPVRTSSLAIWSLVLGFFGLLVCFPAVGGLICGILALIQIGRSQEQLGGRVLAILGLVLSVAAPFVFSIGMAIIIPFLDSRAERGTHASGSTLADARKGFVTQLIRQEKDGSPVDEPPRGVLQKVSYPSPAGELAAYLSPIPADGQKHPAIVWLFGGFSNSIGSTAWDPAPVDNDQSAAAFRSAGIVTLYPSLRGGNQNPGYKERFLGEVEDVLAAADFLAAQPGIDPDRIYLGGHSTGGTLVLLVVETSARFRAAFSFGPAARASDYGSDYQAHSGDTKEHQLRDPISWLRGIRTPTFVFEGDHESANIYSLRELEKAPHHPSTRFYAVPGHTHFSLLAPYTRRIAVQIIADTGSTPHFGFSNPDK